MAMRTFGLSLAIVMFCCPAFASVFGISMGDPISKYKGANLVSNGIYLTDSVPIPNSSADHYFLMASPNVGVCKVILIGKTNAGDDSGSMARAQFASFRQALIAKYAGPRDFDFISFGALWTEPEEWTMAVTATERTLSATWSNDVGSRVPNDLTGITLEVVGRSKTTNFIRLTYEFANFSLCKAELNAVNGKGF